MTTPAANLQVLVEDRLACVKVTGRANFNLSPSFEKLLTELHRNKYQCFVMELTGCLLMDSSFLGVLVGFAVKLRGSDGRAASPRVELHNPNPTVLQLFDDLGVLDLFEVTQGSPPAAQGTETREVTAGQSSKEEITRTCLEAHRTLMAMNPDNVRRFKDVARFLAEDLQKLQGGK